METPSMSRSRQNKVSVALATYNGERFLPPQLASIPQQTRLPDEVELCDERSNEGAPNLTLPSAPADSAWRETWC